MVGVLESVDFGIQVFEYLENNSSISTALPLPIAAPCHHLRLKPGSSRQGRKLCLDARLYLAPRYAPDISRWCFVKDFRATPVGNNFPVPRVQETKTSDRIFRLCHTFRHKLLPICQGKFVIVIQLHHTAENLSCKMPIQPCPIIPFHLTHPYSLLWVTTLPYQ